MNTVLDLGSWCILRMASGDTLRVRDSLASVGLVTWTPVERDVKRLRIDRSRLHRESALMPSYVFGRVEHLNDFLRLAMMPNRQHPKFSVFRHQDKIPLIADCQLAALRHEEERIGRVFDKLLRRGKKGPKLAPGTAVDLPDGPWQGIAGIVEGTEGQYTLVSVDVFGKPQTIKVASLLFADDFTEQAQAA